jgi:hypothetical protein
MALADDLNQLAQQDVAYLTRTLTGGTTSSSIIFRGRLHQSLNGNWVFNTSVGQNGVIGIDLGPMAGGWSSYDTPAGGLQVVIPNVIISGTATQEPVVEQITLTNVIPQDLAD